MSMSAAERHASGGVMLESYLEVGFNYRMTDVAAAIGLVQLGRLDGLVAARREQAARYQELLADVPGLVTATDPEHGTTNYQSFWVLLPEEAPVARNDVLQDLDAVGVSARRGIMAAHLEPAYAGLAHVHLPATERITRDSLILPLHHEVMPADQERIVDVVASAVTAGARR
jgi:perosamine synthetase